MCAQTKNASGIRPSQGSVDVSGEDTKPHEDTEKKPLFPGNLSGMSHNSQSFCPDQEQKNHA